MKFLVDPTLSAFRRGTNLAYYQLNEKVFASQGITLVEGAFVGDTFVGPFLFTGSGDDI